MKSPVYSPDGSKIAFVTPRATTNIWILDLKDLSTRRLMVDNVKDQSNPSWSPDSSQLVFENEWLDQVFPGIHRRLAKINADGSGLQQIGGDEDTSYPSWSSSNQIASLRGHWGSGQISVMAADGTGQQQLTPLGSDYSPAWNPEGSKIAFTRDVDGPFEIFAMNADGSGQTRLTYLNRRIETCYWGRTAQAVGLQTLSIANASVSESESGTSQLHFRVSLSAPATVPVSVNYATADGTATAGADYQKAAGTVFFKVGEKEKFIDVTVLSDLIEESAETVSMTLTNPLGVSFFFGQAVGTIVDDGKVGVTCSSAAVTEGNDEFKSVPLTVSLSGPSTREVSVNYATERGTAYPTADYISTSGTLEFAPGETQKQITVTIKGEGYFYEEDENFSVVLSDLVNAKPVPLPVQDKILNAGNGHWYQLVKTFTAWDAAKASAGALRYNGVNGHLATINSADEQNFVLEHFSPQVYYLGGFEAEADPSIEGYYQRPWYWVTGEPFNYSNWLYGQAPQTISPSESHVLYAGEASRGGPAGKWQTGQRTIPRYYLVEYDTTAASQPDLLPGEVRIINDELQQFPPPLVYISEPELRYLDGFPKPYLKDLPRINGAIDRYGDGSSGDINRVDVSLFRKDIGKYWDGSAWSSTTRVPLTASLSWNGTQHVFQVTAILPSPNTTEDQRKLANGDYEMLVHAFNQYGRVTGDLSFFTVDATLPTVTLTSPLNGAVIR